MGSLKSWNAWAKVVVCYTNTSRIEMNIGGRADAYSGSMGVFSLFVHHRQGKTFSHFYSFQRQHLKLGYSRSYEMQTVNGRWDIVAQRIVFYVWRRWLNHFHFEQQKIEMWTAGGRFRNGQWTEIFRFHSTNRQFLVYNLLFSLNFQTQKPAQPRITIKNFALIYDLLAKNMPLNRTTAQLQTSLCHPNSTSIWSMWSRNDNGHFLTSVATNTINILFTWQIRRGATQWHDK